jgi:hypothetical protein
VLLAFVIEEEPGAGRAALPAAELVEADIGLSDAVRLHANSAAEATRIGRANRFIECKDTDDARAPRLHFHDASQEAT